MQVVWTPFLMCLPFICPNWHVELCYISSLFSFHFQSSSVKDYYPCYYYPLSQTLSTASLLTVSYWTERHFHSMISYQSKTNSWLHIRYWIKKTLPFSLYFVSIVLASLSFTSLIAESCSCLYSLFMILIFFVSQSFSNLWRIAHYWHEIIFLLR